MAALSAEPGRKALHSTDMRWRAMWQRAGIELPFRAIARTLNVAVGTIHNTWKRFVKTGDVIPRKADYVCRSKVLE